MKSPAAVIKAEIHERGIDMPKTKSKKKAPTVKKIVKGRRDALAGIMGSIRGSRKKKAKPKKKS